MAVFEWVRFLAGGLLLLFGLCIFAIEIIGVYRFRYVLNRMHAAAMGDTLGIGFSLLGLIIMSGFNFTSLKLLFVIVFLWFSSPTSSHLIARLEVTTDEEKEKHYRILKMEDIGKHETAEETECLTADVSEETEKKKSTADVSGKKGKKRTKASAGKEA